MTVGLMQTPQRPCNLFGRRTVLKPSSNSIPPIAWVTACATNARQNYAYVQVHYFSMLIAPGSPWGSPGLRPPERERARAEFAAAVAAAAAKAAENAKRRRRARPASAILFYLTI